MRLFFTIISLKKFFKIFSSKIFFSKSISFKSAIICNQFIKFFKKYMQIIRKNFILQKISQTSKNDYNIKNIFKKNLMMLFFVMIIAICGILYELLIGTLSSYLIGNSVQQFSFVIGFFLTGMGI